MSQAIKIKLVHSPCGKIPKHRATVRGLGLRHTNHERIIEDTPATRGMINAVSHLVTIVEEGLPMAASKASKASKEM